MQRSADVAFQYKAETVTLITIKIIISNFRIGVAVKVLISVDKRLGWVGALVGLYMTYSVGGLRFWNVS